MTERDKSIILSHGSGGSMTRDLVEGVFLKAFSNEFLGPLNDQAVFAPPEGRVAFTTDSFVVKPRFFPGGDIGKLAVCGTVNDLAVGGARPLYLSAGFIIEEGLSLAELSRVVESMARTAREEGVMIVTGDTKVVERGSADGLFINTAGVGVVPKGTTLDPGTIRPGDAVIVSGTMGDHGIAVMTEREGMDLVVPVQSDCAPLWTLVSTVLEASGGVRAMRDPTRGGLATVLNEFAGSSSTAIVVDERAVPVRESVAGACEILGFDPLYLANEGKVVVVVDRGSAEDVVKAMRTHPLGRDAAIVGQVEKAPAGKVMVETPVGSRRVVEMLSGEQLPRIC